MMHCYKALMDQSPIAGVPTKKSKGFFQRYCRSSIPKGDPYAG